MVLHFLHRSIDKTILLVCTLNLNYHFYAKHTKIEFFSFFFSTKNTILKKYDGRFKDIFQEIYEK